MVPYPFYSIAIILSLCGGMLLSGCAHTQGSVVSKKEATVKSSVTSSKTAKSGKTQKPSARPAPADTGGYAGKTYRVRTTAYTGTKNAISGKLKHGTVTSAASDWSHFPLGTRFRIRETGQLYVIDDYGSALVGTHTIDLAKRNNSGVRKWGVRWVHIDILEWGSSRRSLEVLSPRQGYRHIRPMVNALRNQSAGMPVRFHRTEVK